ncbi:MAG: threonine--tRNA ligase [Candidatus Njordarchaeia archaeon]
MRIVLLHSDWIEFTPKRKAIPKPEPVEKETKRIEEVLVALVTVEKGDNEEVVENAVKDLLDIKNRVKAPRVVIYPWAHLSHNLADPSLALKLLTLFENKVREEGIEVYRAPFGWYKEFRIAVKGHPLAELSREFKPGKGKEIKKKGEKKFVILAPQGAEIDPVTADLSQYNEDFQILVRKEALKEPLPGGESKVIYYLQRFGFDWEPYSDYGHMRFAPHAALIYDLVAEYSRIVVRKLGLPVYEVKGTPFFNLSEKPVKEHAELYGDRLYIVETDKGEFVLRYAACHQQFSMMKDWVISYKNLPFGAFEIADSYRYEQSGETELSFRLRRFWMPDMHIIVKDEADAKEWVLKVHKLILAEMEKLGRNYELLVNIVSPQQYERYKDFIINLAKDVNKPVLVSIYPPTGLNYYWTINIEYVIRDHLDRPREIGTVQIDIGNAKRFGIKYVDRDNKEKYPVILHTAIIGSIERYIFAQFDTAVSKKYPMLPVWLSPVQVRLIPIRKDFLEFAEKVSMELEKEGFRVDIDDTERSLDRKIVDAEKEWIPYVVVIGKREMESGELTVRIREERDQRKIKLEELIKILKEKTEGYPKRTIYFSKYLSKRPKIMKME